ncbi:MAG: hypothetical protein FWG20_05290 [Candidatus Cloacimonetes bacterium]|nr:hypothetical protein [Candidatus Cloacimonadota bacterium]
MKKLIFVQILCLIFMTGLFAATPSDTETIDINAEKIEQLLKTFESSIEDFDWDEVSNMLEKMGSKLENITIDFDKAMQVIESFLETDAVKSFIEGIGNSTDMFEEFGKKLDLNLNDLKDKNGDQITKKLEEILERNGEDYKKSLDQLLEYLENIK